MTAAPAAHRLPIRVYYEDTDAGGIVYHAQYLCFAERARTELLRTLGTDHRRLLTEDGGLFAVRRLAVDFRAPARLDDMLVVETRSTSCSGARLGLDQKIKRSDQILVKIDVELVFINADLRPRRLPAWLVAAFRRMDDLPSSGA